MFSADQHISNEFGGREEYDNIIKQTRNMTQIMNQQQRFQKAKSHIIDALKNKQSRPMNYSPQVTQLYYILYFVQSSFIWDWLIFLCSFIFMYLVILDNQSYTQKIAFQSSILVLFVIDTLIDFYCKSFDKFKKKNKYPSFYIWKTILISLMIIDLIIFISLPCYNSRVIRPFRILRAFIPVIFDAQIRKTLVSLILTYKILFVFLVYYVIIIFTFALIGSTTLTFDPFFVDSSNPINFDQYIGNYNHLGYMIYQVYAFATYDFYPDNAILAVQNYEPNYLFFIVFIFLNMFIFVSIPGGLIYSKFRQIRSKYIIVDEIKQQHSLILAFVTLAQNQTNLPIATLIKFLFYFYKKKIRYVEYITSICMKLDDNNNLTIQVNEFMEFSKLLLYNSIMYPPTFQDFQIWIKFRTFVNQAIYLKKIVKHWIFNLITSIIIVLSAANTIIHLMNNYQITHTFDTVFVWLFFVELILRITGIGPQKYFTDRWNLIDTCMILLNIIFLFVTTVAGLDNFVRLFRFFRIAGVFKLIIYSNTFIKKRIQIIEGLKRLFSTFLQIMPIIIKFFFLFAFVFYIFGIIGMEVFYNPQFNEIKDDTTYNMFIQFSNFNTFLHSQHLMMQILTEGGWSYNAYDYCWRYPSYYSLIILFFILMHMTIVTVIGTLLKGIFWQIYFTVSGMMDEMQQKLHIHMLKQEQNDIKTQQMQQINQKIKNKQTFDPDTIIKREIIQKKLDKQILIKIKNFQYNNNENEKSKRTINRSKILGEMMESANVSAKELQIQPIKKANTRHFNRFKVQKKISMTFHEIQDKQEEDFQLQMEQLLNRLIISNKLKYSELIAYPKIFVQYLNTKFKKSSDFLHLSQFNLNNNPLSNEQSMNFHAYELTNLLGIQSTSKQRKKMVIQTLLRNRLINQQIAQGISKTQQSLSQFHIDTNGALRKMYLAQTNEDLVNKFQIQYFSDIYGNSFNKINKITLQPVLKFQATLTYCLWNILRYPQINFVDFFNIITHVEDQMSNKLLRKGSLVKFVYKLDHQSDIWFVVDQKINQNTKIRFIKSGLWCQTAEMKNNEPYYSKDIFNWQLKQGTQQTIRKMRDQYIKLFYQSFQTLAFSLIDKKPFFQYNPREYIYDLYMQNFIIDQLDKIKNKQRKSAGSPLRISNIMLIVLSKEDERLDIGEQNLPYKLSQINSKSKQIKDEDYLLNNSATYEKLKNLAAKQQQKIIQSQGLPFSYILNMMKQISDMMKLYSNNFAYQIQSVLNEKDQLFDDSNQQNGIIINLPQVRVHTNQQLN